MSDSGRRILLLGLYYEPDVASTGRYMAGIAEGLADRGHQVEVVCGQPSYTPEAEPAPAEETRENLRVTRLGLCGARGTTPFRARLTAYLCYLCKAAAVAGARLRRGEYDAVLSSHNPPFLGALAALLAAFTSTPLLYAPLDVHPHAAREKFAVPSPLERLWFRAERWALERSAAVSVLSEEVADVYRREFGVSGAKLRVVPLWALHEPDVRPGDGTGSSRGPTFLWSGTMGALHRVVAFVEASKATETPHRLVFLGGGPRRAAVEEALPDASDRIEVRDYLPDDEYDRILRRADVGLVGLRKNASRYCLPSRALTFLASGTPVLVLCDGENPLTRLVRREGCGWHATSRAELEELMTGLSEDGSRIERAASRAETVYRREYSRKKTVEDFAGILEEICLGATPDADASGRPGHHDRSVS